MASKEKQTFYQEPSFQFFVKKGLIKQNNRGQVFPIFTYRVNSQPSQSKYIELKVFPSKIARRSNFQQDSPSPFVITNIPKKNTVYQSYIDNIVKRKLKDKPESPKKYCNSIHEIQGKQIETVKDCFLPKLHCLNSKPQRLKYRHSLPKQDLYTEPNPEPDPSDRLQPWDSSQKSFTLQ
ncbi:unnamed protein product (macronuclear) [Paramecium tetraurelia]|uniref:Uncharacterized protein n=1 Tax=Paramecium tetraurelia TaxID=5888 RepID=A0CSQ2_PARTE|nr:uncharacterized protein GSPATT00010091001 [Paramecium tetraurelia]CAK73819.1 unnamed protein product [Paramecium tetraurelia]|eukprot:XP_001441216.1 hypothetical protein (macronuclear) [Paramecium tetraurelia strain d4-2]